MHLLIVHSHWRPGGVRQVVTAALPTLLADPLLAVRSVILAAGHPPPDAWAQALRTTIGTQVPLRFVTEPLFAYASEWPGGPADHRAALTATATRLIRDLPEPRMVLLENPAVGRHPLIGLALANACAATGTRLVCHHHDFFLDGRWEHWPDWVRCGHGSWRDALASALPDGPGITHLAVTARDAAWLARCRPTTFCPNPVAVATLPEPPAIASARLWLTQTTHARASVWLCPSRVLRRKNLAEAMLLTRLLDPEAVVATTGGVSSPGEFRYAQALARATGPHDRAIHLGLLAEAEDARRAAPTVSALMTASDRVVVPSLFEGFGLPVVEAAALGAACLARREACPDGAAPVGVQAYDEVCVPWEMGGHHAERARQESAWMRWRALLPLAVGSRLPEPPWWHGIGLVPFSRLTLQGQLGALGSCLDPDTAAAVLTLNPALTATPTRRPGGHSTAPPPPITLAAALTADALTPGTPPESADLTRLLDDRLTWANHYPLLWPGGDDPPD